MAEPPKELNEPERTPAKVFRQFPTWLKGFLLGVLFWGLMALGAQLLDRFDGIFPEWFDLPNFIGSICGVLAFPVGLGGWLFIWGDKGPPYAWMNRFSFHVAFGICFYGLLGAVVSPWIAKWRSKSRR